jgi:hypothetical protein
MSITAEEQRELSDIVAGMPYPPGKLAEIRATLPPHLRARLAWLDWDESDIADEMAAVNKRLAAWRLVAEEHLAKQAARNRK